MTVCVFVLACGGSEFGRTGTGSDAGAGGSAGTGGHAGTGGRETGGTSAGGSGGLGTGGVMTGGMGGTGGSSTGGTAGSGGGGGGSGTCGGLLGTQCADTQWCDYPSGTGSDCGSGDLQGTCYERPSACPLVYSPVCGCDGKFYPSACDANAAGTDTTTSTSCFSDAGTAGTVCQSNNDCQQGLLCCYPCGIPGCQNQCTAAVNGSCPWVL